MKANQTDFYTSANFYVEGSESMRNEVTMLYVVGAFMLQEMARQHLHAEPFGGIGAHVGALVRESFPEVTVLDVCCGPGNVGNYLGMVIPRMKLTGIDKSDIFINAAKRKFEKLPWEFIVADARKFDLGRAFDFVTGSSAYHHIEDEFKVTFLNSIRKHLKPDGRVILCENFLPPYSSDSDRERSVNRYYQDLKAYYISGNGTEQALVAIEEVHQLELSKDEEHKVHYEIFESHVREAGLEIDKRVAVWQSPSGDGAGSYVISLRHGK